MDEHIEEPTPEGRPDPIYSPLHEGQMSLMPEPEQPERDYRPDETASWSPVDASTPMETTDPEPERVSATRTEAAAQSLKAAFEAIESGDDAPEGSEPVSPSGDAPGTEEDLAPDTPDAGTEDAETTTDDVTAEAGLAPDTTPGEAEGPPAPAESPAASPEGTAADTSTATGAAQSEPSTDAGTPEAAWPALAPHASGASTYDLPPLERDRPARERLVPRWVWVALASTLAVLALAAGGIWWFLSSSLIAVPDVSGLQLSVARSRLEAVGLDVQVTDRRFSPAPRDEVLSQDPGAGGELRRGSVVQLVVSAGTEEIVMPDVVGDGLTLARSELEGRGLVVIVDAVPSDLPSDTVLGTTPAPGAIVRTGDSVRVTVAAPVGGTNGLSPYNLQGFGLVLDPAPTGTASDTTMEVARRVRSLLEAAGASVTVLRSATETNATDAQRAQAASTATGTVAIGLSIAPTGSAGRHVSIPVTGTPDVLQRSQLLASSISSQLAGVAPPVTSSTSSTETVLQGSRLAWARIVLGSASAREDQTKFADPAWADQMARAIYTALGELYGVREQ